MALNAPRSGSGTTDLSLREHAPGLSWSVLGNEHCVTRLGAWHRSRSAVSRNPSVPAVLQTALVYVNTLMVQDVLADDAWSTALTNEDRRALTPLFWAHVAPYGEIKLDMRTRLTLNTPND
jgi:hypothetical protein